MTVWTPVKCSSLTSACFHHWMNLTHICKQREAEVKTRQLGAGIRSLKTPSACLVVIHVYYPVLWIESRTTGTGCLLTGPGGVGETLIYSQWNISCNQPDSLMGMNPLTTGQAEGRCSAETPGSSHFFPTVANWDLPGLSSENCLQLRSNTRFNLRLCCEETTTQRGKNHPADKIQY